MGPSHNGASQGLRVARTGSGPTRGVATVPASPASASPLAGTCMVLQTTASPCTTQPVGLGSRMGRRTGTHWECVLLIPVALASAGSCCTRIPTQQAWQGWPGEHEDPACHHREPPAIQAIPCPAGVTSKVTARPVSPQTSWGEGLGPPAADAADESRDGWCWRTRQLPPGHVQQQQILLWLCRPWPRGAPSWAELVPAGGARPRLHVSPAMGPRSCHLLSQVPA